MLKINRIKLILIDVFVFFMILSNYSIFFLENSPIIYLGIVISGISVLVLNNFNSLKKTELIVLCFFFADVCILLLFGKNFVDKTFIVIFVILIISYLIISAVEKEEGMKVLLNSFVKVVFFIAAISIIGFVFCTVFKLVKPLKTVSSDYYNWSPWFGYNNYYYLYFDGQFTNIFGKLVIRDIAIFAEAPLFATLISEALFINAFLLDNNRKYNIVLIIAAILTLSTTSLIVSSIIVFISLYKKYLRNKKLIILLPFILLFTFIIIGISIYDKLLSNNISGNVRIDDFIACYNSWKNAPIIGNGFKNFDVLDEYRATWRQKGSAGLSTGIGGVFSDGGIILASLYVIPTLLGVVLFRRIKNKEMLFFVFLIFIMFCIMIFQYTALGMFFVALSWHIILKNINYNQKKIGE